ncbi:hypothetical protein IIA15_04305 [candidate division TA06 bacterium]|nr:hypothetical protein [candidate division TA06 bacterium]
MTNLIDAPTAGFLPPGSFALTLRMEPDGGVLGGMAVQPMDAFLTEVSYGGENIIGSGEVDWNPRVEFEGRWKFLQERFALPSIALGFASQGYDGHTGGRYRIKSKGFYAVASKGFNLFGHLGLHGGINRTFEGKEGEKKDNGKDKDITFFFGFDKGLGESFSIVGEYDLAQNDDEENGVEVTDDNGYLNLGFRWNYLGSLFLEFDFRNLRKHRDQEKNRIVKLEYIEFF